MKESLLKKDGVQKLLASLLSKGRDAAGDIPAAGG